MIKYVTRSMVLVSGIGFVFLALAFAEKTTELYVPIGKSPGLSHKFTLVGTIVEVNSQEQTLSVTGASGTYTVRTTEYTLIYLDKSRLRQPNRYGSFSDFKAGMLVEVRYEAGKKHRPAEWIKLQMDK